MGISTVHFGLVGGIAIGAIWMGSSSWIALFEHSPVLLTSLALIIISYILWLGVFSSTGKSGSNLFGINKDISDTTKKVNTYEELFDDSKSSKVEDRKSNYTTVVNHYYDLATDFYEWGWGESFHFAPRHKRESMKTSLARHEMYLALKLGVKKGMKVLDVGCGVGGPMREIARFSGANVTGINNNGYQISRGQKHNKEMGLDSLCDFIKGDFMHIPVQDETYDGVYAIEATCHAPNKIGIYSEIFRVMKPGAGFAAYEWCMTPKYDENNPEHRRIKYEIEIGDGLPELARTTEVVEALKKIGFEIIEVEDLAPPNIMNSIPWWQSFEPSVSLQGFKLTKFGIACTHTFVSILETLRILPVGSTKTHSILIRASQSLLAGAKLGIFTPCYFFHVRKPIQHEVLQKCDATQALLMQEMCITLDNNDKVIGYDTKKTCHLNENIEKGLLHRAFSILLFNKKGELLLQQRAAEKITFPSFWTNTVCSHPLYNDLELDENQHIGVKRAAQRKIEHELGVKPGQVPLDKFKFITRIHYKAPFDEIWGEHEIDYILIIQADVDLNINQNEVMDTKYVSKEELKELIASANQKGVKITPWFQLIVDKFLYSWWDNLGNLDAVVDEKTIHHL